MEKNIFFTLFKEAENDSRYHAEGLKLEIAEQIFKFMEKREVNQTKLAEIMGVNRAYISRILKGNVNLTIETLGKISCGLNSEWKIELRELEKSEKEILSDGFWNENAEPTRVFLMPPSENEKVQAQGA